MRSEICECSCIEHLLKYPFTGVNLPIVDHKPKSSTLEMIFPLRIIHLRISQPQTSLTWKRLREQWVIAQDIYETTWLTFHKINATNPLLTKLLSLHVLYSSLQWKSFSQADGLFDHRNLLAKESLRSKTSNRTSRILMLPARSHTTLAKRSVWVLDFLQL